ncbi:pleckstrin homology domain-containing family F member 2 isoform X2 [Perognathus longimembris pacificus]|uniref:pleckstrin homology domain-containing family F member 2 isoform X2 n=1 Tax=Perognathus longimembris pacificus TaxID=214514 RepID=UPI00201884A1|nr:pleckstrin homology domain-containing family F member 2 isoform X2 [Perognathus longimembris pacificus]
MRSAPALSSQVLRCKPGRTRLTKLQLQLLDASPSQESKVRRLRAPQRRLGRRSCSDVEGKTPPGTAPPPGASRRTRGRGEETRKKGRVASRVGVLVLARPRLACGRGRARARAGEARPGGRCGVPREGRGSHLRASAPAGCSPASPPAASGSFRLRGAAGRAHREGRGWERAKSLRPESATRKSRMFGAATAARAKPGS